MGAHTIGVPVMDRPHSNYPPPFSARRSGAMLLISASALPGSPISESMSSWIALIVITHPHFRRADLGRGC
jgi:hypothetical protein